MKKGSRLCFWVENDGVLRFLSSLKTFIIEKDAPPWNLSSQCKLKKYGTKGAEKGSVWGWVHRVHLTSRFLKSVSGDADDTG